jgi:hypothetical protein
LTGAEREQRLLLDPDLRYVSHGGGCVAYFNYIIRLLDTQRTILVLTNCGPITPAWILEAFPAHASGRIRSRGFSSAAKKGDAALGPIRNTRMSANYVRSWSTADLICSTGAFSPVALWGLAVLIIGAGATRMR